MISDFVRDVARRCVWWGGPSGAGKGVGSEEMMRNWSKSGYTIMSFESGNLFRNIGKQPGIEVSVGTLWMPDGSKKEIKVVMPELSQEAVEAKKVMDNSVIVETLNAIMPQLDQCMVQVMSEFGRNPKSIALFDGFLRRTEVFTEQGVRVPSQVEQVAGSMTRAVETMGLLNIVGISYGDMCRRFSDSIINGRHVLVDVSMEDAFLQMAGRCGRGVRKLVDSVDNEPELKGLLDSLVALVEGRVDESISFLDLSKQPRVLRGKDAERVSDSITRVITKIAKELGLKEKADLNEVAKQLGVEVMFRSDDLFPGKRWGRLSPYAEQVKMDDGSTLWKLGSVGTIMVAELGYEFNEKTGEFSSNRFNSHILRNGESRGVGLQSFLEECANKGEDILVGMERWSGIEATRAKNREVR